MVSYERLPMLEIVFDRLVRLMTTSLRNFTSDNVEVSLDRITSVRFGDYMNSIPLPAVLCVFKAEEWDNFGLMTVNSSLIYSIIDVLLGGRRGQTAVRIEGRPYTTIESNLVKRMIEVVLADAELAFVVDPVDGEVRIYGVGGAEGMLGVPAVHRRLVRHAARPPPRRLETAEPRYVLQWPRQYACKATQTPCRWFPLRSTSTGNASESWSAP